MPAEMGGTKMTDPFTPDLVDFIHETLDEWKLAGLSVAVVDGDDVFAKVCVLPNHLIPFQLGV